MSTFDLFLVIYLRFRAISIRNYFYKSSRNSFITTLLDLLQIEYTEDAGAVYFMSPTIVTTLNYDLVLAKTTTKQVRMVCDMILAMNRASPLRARDYEEMAVIQAMFALINYEITFGNDLVLIPVGCYYPDV